MTDLTQTTRRTAAVAAGVTDAQLEAPTPMDTPVRVVLQHLLGLAVAFRDAAGKIDGPTTSSPPAPDDAPLPDTWRDDLADRLDELARAWAEPGAWTGMTKAGGVDLPGEVCGLVAMNEVLLHGWDLSAATGAPYDPGDAECEAVLPIVSPSEEVPDGSDRGDLFGAVVPVPEDAPYFHQVLGLAGRDPGWSPA